MSADEWELTSGGSESDQDDIRSLPSPASPSWYVVPRRTESVDFLSVASGISEAKEIQSPDTVSHVQARLFDNVSQAHVPPQPLARMHSPPMPQTTIKPHHQQIRNSNIDTPQTPSDTVMEIDSPVVPTVPPSPTLSPMRPSVSLFSDTVVVHGLGEHNDSAGPKTNNSYRTIQKNDSSTPVQSPRLGPSPQQPTVSSATPSPTIQPTKSIAAPTTEYKPLLRSTKRVNSPTIVTYPPPPRKTRTNSTISTRSGPDTDTPQHKWSWLSGLFKFAYDSGEAHYPSLSAAPQTARPSSYHHCASPVTFIAGGPTIMMGWEFCLETSLSEYLDERDSDAVYILDKHDGMIRNKRRKNAPTNALSTSGKPRSSSANRRRASLASPRKRSVNSTPTSSPILTHATHNAAATMSVLMDMDVSFCNGSHLEETPTTTQSTSVDAELDRRFHVDVAPTLVSPNQTGSEEEAEKVNAPVIVPSAEPKILKSDASSIEMPSIQDDCIDDYIDEIPLSSLLLRGLVSLLVGTGVPTASNSFPTVGIETIILDCAIPFAVELAAY